MSAAARPRIRMQRTSLESLLDLCSGILLGYTWGNLYLVWNILPSKIPTHFGITGIPDSWGTKSSLWMLPLIASLLAALLAMIRHFPQMANYPWPITPANAAQQYRIVRSMLSWLMVELVWIFTYLEWATIGVARGKATGLNPLVLLISLVVVLSTTAFHLIKGWQAQ